MRMSQSAANYFSRDEYIDYLRQYCDIGHLATKGRIAGAELILQVLAMLEIQPADKVLEIGCGLGRVLELLRQEFQAEVYGCDISEPAILHIKEHTPALAARVHCAPSEALGFALDEAFDCVLTWGVFELT